MEHYCVRCQGQPIYGVFSRVYEYTRSVIVAAHGLAIAAHGMYHDNPENPETTRAICQLAANSLNAWLYNRLPAYKNQYNILANARDTFRQLSIDLDHDSLVSLEATLAEYLKEEDKEE
jgi:hypothetical protein